MHRRRVPVSLVNESDDPIVSEVFARLAGGAVGVVNIHRALANSPEVFSAFIGFAHALRFKTQLDPAERELAILRALWRHEGYYEIGHHRRIGAAAGLTIEEMDAACGAAGTETLSARRKLLVDYADRFAQGGDIDPELSEALLETLGNRGVVELSLTLALYVGLAHLTGALDVPVD